MTAAVEQILGTALKLSPLDRADLIDELLKSFDAEPRNEIEEAWKVEVESRLDAYHAGKIAASPAEEVLARILAR